MATERLFDKWEQAAFRAGLQARTKSSMAWFKKNVSNLKVSRKALIAQGPRRVSQVYGSMYNFEYDPKTKATLPYYDRFPLVLPLERIPGGFAGINFHYLRPVARFSLLERLQRFSTRGREITSRNSFDVSYDRVKNIPLVKNTIKKYLFNNVRSSFLRIDYDKAALSVYLPVAQFRKGSPY